jgi:hypothetical protein
VSAGPNTRPDYMGLILPMLGFALLIWWMVH